MSEGDQGGELGCDSLRRSSRAGAEVTDSICGGPCHGIAQSSGSEVSEPRRAIYYCKNAVKAPRATISPQSGEGRSHQVPYFTRF